MEIAFKSALGLSIIGEAECLYNFFVKYNDVLIERLYKRYVRREDVECTLKLLEEKINSSNTNDIYIFRKLYNLLKERCSLSEKCLQKFGKYIPVRIVIFDEPFCTISDNIPLEDYDNNDGEPFWMRPGYILEHYSKSNRK